MKTLAVAFRSFLKAPLVSALAVLSLSLGMGANAAIFSLFDELILRPLPVPQPGLLVNLRSDGPKPGSNSCNQAGDCEYVFSYPMFRDLEREQTVFAGVAAHRIFGANLAYGGETTSGNGMLVSGSYFPTLGLLPAAGRLFAASDDGAKGEPAIVVLGHRYWKQRFGLDPKAVGQSLIVNGQTLAIVGVAPAGFRGTTLGSEPDVYVPMTLRETMEPGFGVLDERLSYWAYLFARLAPGQTPRTAKTALDVVYRRILHEVEVPLQDGMSAETLERFKAREILLEPGAHGQSSMRNESGPLLALLFGVAAVVLLIACANVANLLLARAATRTGEMAIRLSIGASRGTLVRQLLVESWLLSTVAALAGLAVGAATLRGVVRLLPPDALAGFDLALDGRALAFSAVVALATGVLFGLFPAFQATGVDLVTTLKGHSGQPSGARTAARVRAGLVVSQIALSTALLAGAGLLTKSLQNIGRVNLGVEIEHLVTFGLSPSLNGYKAEQARSLFERVESELRALPGVTRATGSLVPLLGGSNWGSNLSVEGFEAGPDTNTNARFNEVGPGYFAALGVPLLAGREIGEGDVVGSPKVAVVNQAFLRKFALGDDAVGRRFTRGRTADPEKLDIEIVGIVPDIAYSAVKDEIPPLFYTPYRQDERLGFANFYLHTTLPPEQTLPAIRKLVASLDPNLPVEGLKTMPQQVRESLTGERVLTTLTTGFAVLATVLAAVGLYGVLAYTVSLRTRELGLRMALGADGARLRGLVLRQVGVLAGIGAVLGLAGGWGLGVLARSQLYQIQGHDPMVLAGATALIAGIALLAGLVPAVRASRLDPMRALRYE